MQGHYLLQWGNFPSTNYCWLKTKLFETLWSGLVLVTEYLASAFGRFLHARCNFFSRLHRSWPLFMRKKPERFITHTLGVLTYFRNEEDILKSLKCLVLTLEMDGWWHAVVSDGTLIAERSYIKSSPKVIRNFLCNDHVELKTVVYCLEATI